MVQVARPYPVRWSQYGKPHELAFHNVDVAASLYGLLLSRQEAFCVSGVETVKDVVTRYIDEHTGGAE